jgi:predicted RecA/RadA family phage recombinase
VLSACTPKNVAVPQSSEPVQGTTESPISDLESTGEVTTDLTYELPVFSTTSLNDDNLIYLLEYDLKTQLEENEGIIIESVESIYVSQEYIDELEYNSKENIYYGYKLSELDEQFGDVEYAFTVEGDKTIVVPIINNNYDNTLNTVIKNTAVGSGVIILLVTASIVTGGAGTPVNISTAHLIFTCAAKSAAIGASTGTATGGVFGGAKELANQLSKGKEVNWSELGKAAAVEASKGLKWGAVIGAVTGGIQSTVKLAEAGKNVGTYGDLKIANNGKLLENGEEIHHVIPKASGSELSEGLAIKISKANHRMLTSTGSSKEAIAFRAEIKGLLDAGKLKEAYTMGFDDIIAKTGNQYLAEIIELKKLTGLF